MKPAALSFGFGKALLLVSAFALLLCGAEACADPEGTTPDCVQDVDGKKHDAVDNGCNPFALCIKGGQVVNPTQCCEGLTSFELEACLYGYGAGPAPTGGTSSSGGGGGGGGGSN